MGRLTWRNIGTEGLYQHVIFAGFSWRCLGRISNFQAGAASDKERRSRALGAHYNKERA